MRIAINTRFANYGYVEGYGRFAMELSHRLALSGGSDNYLFIQDRPSSVVSDDPPNVQRLTVGPPARHPLLWKFWYDVRIPLLLKSRQADLFFSPDGICSLTTRVPQLLAVHDLAFLHHPEMMPRAQRLFYERNTPRFIRKASRIVTVSEFSRQDIIRQYPFAAGKVDVVHNAADPILTPITPEQAFGWKEEFSEGREYFLCLGSIHPRKNLINLLKAFSLFKKRQRTNMLLVIAGRMAWKHDEFTRALSGFKFRHDVVLTGYVTRQRLRMMLGSAYALVYPSLWEGFGLPVVEAMQAGVPVLCSDNTSMPEVAGDAALYFDPLQPEQMGMQLSRIFKDEQERGRMILRGLERAKAFNWDDAARRVREIMSEAVHAGINP